jgi:Thermostable hemolysin
MCRMFASPTAAQKHHRFVLTRIEADHPDRNEVEAFIAAVYRECYDAELRSFLPHLIAFRDHTGALQAAVGVRYARDGRLFVEQYLDADADTEVARVQRTPIPRERVVEVGNFASRTAGDAREVIVRLTGLLHGEGMRWVLFAATRQLRNTFDRLHLATVPLAPADPLRLQETQNHWGRYYDAKPLVLTGDIASGYAYLQRRAEDADPSERQWLLSSVLRSSCAAAG